MVVSNSRPSRRSRLTRRVRVARRRRGRDRVGKEKRFRIGRLLGFGFRVRADSGYAGARTADVRGARPSLRGRDQTSPRRRPPRRTHAVSCLGSVGGPTGPEAAVGFAPSSGSVQAQQGRRLGVEPHQLYILGSVLFHPDHRLSYHARAWSWSLVASAPWPGKTSRGGAPLAECNGFSSTSTAAFGSPA